MITSANFKFLMITYSLMHHFAFSKKATIITITITVNVTTKLTLGLTDLMIISSSIIIAVK